MSDTERTEQTTEVAEQKQTTSLETDFSKGVFASSNNFKMAWQMAQALASSSIVPQNFQKNPSNCLIAIEQANRLNMSPFLVMQNLYVIQGRPSWSSQWIIAAVNNSGKFDIELQFDEKKDKDGKPFLHPRSPCPIFDRGGCEAASGEYFAFIHNTFDFKSTTACQPRRQLYLIAGKFDPKGEQPIRFSLKPKLFNERTYGNSLYASYTVVDGEGVLWFPDVKYYLLGRKIGREWFE